ncbi:hypothetical protein IMW82_13470 [Rhodanobacter sp. B2A1Ga4]|uniref:hypothetical protein n=1 Tax=Rhodanobacter sp. B2A1Ga4 TaxID=2778647 RepID=UPI001B39295F|nr:hypothetical protein [Rhodanobacter sp. B2A1Ga4]MBQ4855681.1 hypothetical protein [Rhodanobacter sp. B2A1Ga4]
MNRTVSEKSTTPTLNVSEGPATPARRAHRFRLKLANLYQLRWTTMPEDSIGGWANPQANPKGLYGPGLLDQHFGNACDYGALFTYLFRRFGFPNAGSDDYKEIACYVLTTPLPDLVMVASPSVGDWPRLSLRFQVTEEAWNKLEREPRAAWTRNLVAWVEAAGPLPDWMDDWLAFWRTKPGIQPLAKGDASDWAMSIQDMHFVQFELKDERPANWSDELYALLQKVAAFVETIHREFKAIEPHPAHTVHDADWRNWPDTDPLKRYYAAAATALEDLSTPVRVRDSQINAHGRVPDGDPLARRTLKEPRSAGFGVGHFVNRQPGMAMKILREAQRPNGTFREPRSAAPTAQRKA